MASIHDMLTNDRAYPDTLEITAPDGSKVQLGALRGAFFERERVLNEQADAIGKARMEMTTAFQNVMAEREDLARRSGELEAQLKTITASAPGDASAARIAALETALGEARTEFDRKLSQANEGTREAIEQYVYDRIGEQLKKVELPKGMTPKDIIEYALDNNFKSGKMPDIERAVERLREPEMWEKKIEAAREEGYKKAQAEQAMASVHGSSRVVTREDAAPPGVQKFKDFDAAIAAAANDPKIQGMLAGTIRVNEHGQEI